MQLDLEKQEISIDNSELAKDQDISDSFISITLDAYQIIIPIKADSQVCQVTNLSFEQSDLDIDYYLGTGSLYVPIP